MLKLTAGQGPHTSPADCNSFIYAPGAEYVTFALLRPFGLQLDIRACRGVTVLFGVVSAVLTGGLACRVGALLGGKSLGRGARVVASIVAAGIIFRNYLGDACHPDNLYGLHAMLLMTLLTAAVSSGRFGVAMAAIALAGVAILVKQTAALGFVGTAAVLVWFGWRRWGVSRTALLLGWGLLWFAGAAWVLLHGWGRFWTMTVPSMAHVEWFRRLVLAGHYTGQMPYRMLLFFAFAPSLVYVALRSRRSEGLRKLLAVWGAIGVTEVLPALLSYFKAWGYWNNLIIVDVWMAIPILGVLWHAARGDREDPGGARRPIAVGAMITLLVTLVPTRTVPTEEEYAFGRALDAAVARDKAEGKRVLVSQGVATLVHNGILEVPLDRWSSGAELETARLPHDSTRARVAGRFYRKLYILQDSRYGRDVEAMIDQNYHQVATIPGASGPPDPPEQLAAFDFMRGGIRVFEANQ
jgi:hypothetical protein